MKFTQRLAQYLKIKKISVQEFAEAIGVDGSAVYGYLAGKYPPSPKTAKKIRDFTKKQITLDHIYED